LATFFYFLDYYFFPPVIFSIKNIKSTGDSALNYYKILFLGGVALLLFFLLKGVRKILGIGRAMRSFF